MTAYGFPSTPTESIRSGDSACIAVLHPSIDTNNKGRMTSSTKVQLPKMLPVTKGAVVFDQIGPCDFYALKHYQKHLATQFKLLQLLPDEHKEDAEQEDRTTYVYTNNLPALKYAFENEMLSEFLTCMDQVASYLVDQGLDDDAFAEALDELEQGDRTSLHLLEDGNLYVRIES